MGFKKSLKKLKKGGKKLNKHAKPIKKSVKKFAKNKAKPAAKSTAKSVKKFAKNKAKPAAKSTAKSVKKFAQKKSTKKFVNKKLPRFTSKAVKKGRKISNKVGGYSMKALETMKDAMESPFFIIGVVAVGVVAFSIAV